MTIEPADFIRLHVPKEALLGLVQGVRSARHTAGKSIRDLGLSGNQGAAVAGHAAHCLVEAMMHKDIPVLGGEIIDSGIIPGTDVVVHQVVGRFGRVLISRATIAPHEKVPRANCTRRSLASLNAPFDKQLALSILPPPPTWCHALILTTRDPKDVCALAAIKIAVVASDFSGLSFVADLEAFLATYDAPEAKGETSPDGDTGGDIGPVLRPDRGPFRGGEHGPPDDDADKDSGKGH